MNYDHDALFNAYLPRIQNLTHPNHKLYITFSAVTGSGKTWLAKRIARHFSGLYLSADEVRQSALELWPTISRQELNRLIAGFAPSIQNRLQGHPNQLHIVDTNIDKYARQVFAKAEEIGFPLYIIRLDIEKPLLVERIKSRDQNSFQDDKTLLDSLDDNLDYHEKFRREFGDNISYTCSGMGEKDLDQLFASIENALTQRS